MEDIIKRINKIRNLKNNVQNWTYHLSEFDTKILSKRLSQLGRDISALLGKNPRVAFGFFIYALSLFDNASDILRLSRNKENWYLVYTYYYDIQRLNGYMDFTQQMLDIMEQILESPNPTSTSLLLFFLDIKFPPITNNT